jgi:hypothetical protein
VCVGGGGVKKTKRIGEGENKDGVRGKIRGRKEKGLRERGRTKNDWGGGEDRSYRKLGGENKKN